MGSWIRCRCDHLVHKNLFCGTGISLVITEKFLDKERPSETAEDLVSEMIRSSEMLLKCSNCGRVIILKETIDEFDVRFFTPDTE